MGVLAIEFAGSEERQLQGNSFVAFWEVLAIIYELLNFHFRRRRCKRHFIAALESNARKKPQKAP
jgi:hypothetical protein